MTGLGGGGILNGSYSNGGLLRIFNSTISANSSNGNGGGIFNRTNSERQTILINSTVVDNVVDTDRNGFGVGGGLFNQESDRLIVQNSIIANNRQSNDFPSDGFGIINGANNNLVGSLNNIEGTLGSGNDLVNPNVNLSPLQDNGGLTLTHIPLANSPAIDGGNNQLIPPDAFDFDGDGIESESLPFDGIGNQRIFGASVDIGAIEFGSTTVGINPPETEERVNSSETIYRFFNSTTGVHFYTANEIERDVVIDNLPEFNFEGASYLGVDPLTGQIEPSPVYRFFNRDTGVHLYTISEVERDVVTELDNFSFDGEVFFAYGVEIEGTIPIYRFFNSTTGAHFYTPSVIERDAVIDNLPDFQSEGIAYYAFRLEDF